MAKKAKIRFSRSKRYFAIRQVTRHLIRWMDIAHAMIERTKPIPKYPPGTVHPGGPAIVGESGPERVFPRIELLAGTQVLPDSLIRECLFDVKITNAFTPNARMTVKRVQQ